jgi:hypothetical protein
MYRRFVFALSSVMIVAAPWEVCAAAGKKLVVVAASEFQASLAEFLAHKAKQLPTECVALEDVLKGQTGVDDPEKLKRFLFQRWRDDRLGYAVLVGDVDVMPVRYIVLDRVTPAAFDYAFYPSDLYYADLVKPDGPPFIPTNPQ